MFEHGMSAIDCCTNKDFTDSACCDVIEISPSMLMYSLQWINQRLQWVPVFDLVANDTRTTIFTS